MAKFEKVSRFADIDINLPQRKTAQAAGYDMEVAEDIVIPSYLSLCRILDDENADIFKVEKDDQLYIEVRALSLDEMAAITKRTKAKPTLES